MTQRFPLSRGLVGLLIAPLLAIGCKTKTETKYVDVVVTTPSVSVAGAEFVIITGKTIQLTASTAGDGTDTAYDWSSSNASVASVTGTTATVTVSGLTPGNAILTATGQTTGAVGKFNVVVANEIPQVAEWQKSGHADITAEQFTHWKSDADGLIDAGCVRCHSSTGYVEYLGTGATNPAISTLTPAANGEGIQCKACHSAAAMELSQVTFPSGAQLKNLGGEARCMTCHQGRESTVSVDSTIATKKTAAGFTGTDDEVVPNLKFVNIHYFGAAVTLNGGRTKGPYQYATAPDGVTAKVYDWRFRHVPGFDTCIGCHDPHNLEVKVDSCATCHTNVTGATYADKLAKLRDIRMNSSVQDYDGDGNTTEGIAAEVDGVRAKLVQGIAAYAKEKTPSGICYDAATYPYFFQSAGTDMTCSASEIAQATRVVFADWTPNLLKAAFNYQASVKDPGAFAHNAKYTIQYLSDSLESLNAALTTKIPVAGMVRNDFGHFDGTRESARDWDSVSGNPPLASADAAVGTACSKCHGGSVGYKYFLQYGVTKGGVEPTNGFDCSTCHKSFSPFPTVADPNLEQPASVLFASTKSVAADTTTGATKLDKTSMVCMTCHSGREAKYTVDLAVAAAADGGSLSFKNVHYLAAGATLLGDEAQVGYQYAGKTYQKRGVHGGGINCNGCHNGAISSHTFSAPTVYASVDATCSSCHDAATVEEIRDVFAAVPDLDGDADVTEPLASEIEGLKAKLLAQMQTVDANICYAPTVYPYFLTGASTNGICNAGVTTKYPFKKGAALSQTALFQAAFNYQFATKDPGAWAHNYRYVAELLIDSTEALGGDVTGLTRP